MYIKSIIIDGFKSYGKRTEINGFDPEFTAITGLNGTGKSNILDSICFVLGISKLDQVIAQITRRTQCAVPHSVCTQTQSFQMGGGEHNHKTILFLLQMNFVFGWFGFRCAPHPYKSWSTKMAKRALQRHRSQLYSITAKSTIVRWATKNAKIYRWRAKSLLAAKINIGSMVKRCWAEK